MSPEKIRQICSKPEYLPLYLITVTMVDVQGGRSEWFEESSMPSTWASEA
jgi:hypothetical protein